MTISKEASIYDLKKAVKNYQKDTFLAYDDIGIKLWEVQIDTSHHGQEKLNQLQNLRLRR